VSLLPGEVHGVRKPAAHPGADASVRAYEPGPGLARRPGACYGGLPGRGTLADHPQRWSGARRITAGHLAVRAERAAAEPFELTLFDGPMDAAWNWSQRDEAMATRILAGSAAGIYTPARFATIGPQGRQIRLYQHGDALVLELPLGRQAAVPQRSQLWPPAYDTP
jgi:hypothetical protein